MLCLSLFFCVLVVLLSLLALAVVASVAGPSAVCLALSPPSQVVHPDL